MVAVRSKPGTSGYLCYLLASTKHPQKTYVGITNNFQRRIRQHNGELVGGARATRIGRPWIPYCIVEGFPNKTSTLQFEWMWKHSAPKKSHGRKARIQKLKNLLQKEQWTVKAPLAKDIPLTVTVFDHVRDSDEDGLPCWELDLLTSDSVLPGYIRVEHRVVVHGDGYGEVVVEDAD